MTFKNIFRIIWLVLVALVLLVSLFGFDGKPNSDIGVLLAWSMTGLTAPAGLLVPLIHVILYDAFQKSIPTSYASLFLDWLTFSVLGYLQWFVAVPFLIRRIWKWRVLRNASNRVRR